MDIGEMIQYEGQGRNLKKQRKVRCGNSKRKWN